MVALYDYFLLGINVLDAAVSFFILDICKPGLQLVLMYSLFVLLSCAV